MTFGITVTSPPIKKVSLHIRRAEHYTYPMLCSDLEEAMPWTVDALKGIINELCGGADTQRMNAATLLPMVKNKEPSVLSALPDNAVAAIRRFLINEIQKESTNGHEYHFNIPDTYTLNDIKELVRSQIECNDLIDANDYVFAPTFTQSHTGNHFNVWVYYAVNNFKEDQNIKDLIKLNGDKIMKSMNDISVLLY